MGPSGSGKTSLLNVLAQRVPHKNVTGSVFVDGSPLSKSFKRRMGFVFQVASEALWPFAVSFCVQNHVDCARVESVKEAES